MVHDYLIYNNLWVVWVLGPRVWTSWSLLLQVWPSWAKRERAESTLLVDIGGLFHKNDHTNNYLNTWLYIPILSILNWWTILIIKCYQLSGFQKKTKNIQQMMNTIVSCLISDQLFAKYQVFINKQTSRGVQRQRRHCF